MTATASFTERLCAPYDLEHPHRDHDARVTRADMLEYIGVFSVDKPPDHPTTAIQWDLIRTFGEKEGRRLLLQASRQWDAVPLRARDIVFKWFEDDHEPVAWQDEYLADLIGSWRRERDRLRRCADGEREWEALSNDFYIKQSDYDAWLAEYGGWLCPGTLKKTYGNFKIVPDGCSNVLQFPVAMDKPQMPMPAGLPPQPAAPLPDLIKTSSQFVQDFEPPEYLIDGVLQRRYFYSVTAQTGVGKTAIAMRWTAHVASGAPLGATHVEQGTVLYFAGENPTDVQARWLGVTRAMGLDPVSTDVHFLVGAMDLSTVAQRISAEVVTKGLDLALVVVDTAAAYNFGDDENSNTQAGGYARQLRSLTQLPGGPCVVVLCHPTKNASDDNMQPRGGSAFICEVDGNMAVQKADMLLAVTPHGKFRGDMSWVLKYELEVIRDHPTLKDVKGRNIPTVIAKPVADGVAAALEMRTDQDTETVLRAVDRAPGAKPTDIARALGWTYGAMQEPAVKRVNANLARLKKGKLAIDHLGRWKTTSAGQHTLNDIDNAKAAGPKPMFPMPLPPTFTPPTV